MVKYLPNYYKILKITQNANKREINQAYQLLSQKYNKKIHSQKHKLIKDAFIVLSDDKKRKKYDKILFSLKNNKNKKIEKNQNNIKETIDLVNDVKDKYDLISKLFNVGSKTMKGKSLFTGTNLIIGGAMAGYGLKKGRDYMTKRGKRNEE